MQYHKQAHASVRLVGVSFHNMKMIPSYCQCSKSMPRYKNTQSKTSVMDCHPQSPNLKTYWRRVWLSWYKVEQKAANIQKSSQTKYWLENKACMFVHFNKSLHPLPIRRNREWLKTFAQHYTSFSWISCQVNWLPLASVI